jgi:hypothetical protein
VRLGGQRTATLEIGAVSDPDALVRVDGIVRGNPPLMVEGLSPGSHALELEARGYELARANIRLEAGETRAVDLMLSPKLAPTTETPIASALHGSPQETGALAGEPNRLEKTAAARQPVRRTVAENRPAKLSEPAAEGEPTREAAPPNAEREAPAAEQAPSAEPAAAQEAESESEPAGEAQINTETAAVGQGELAISTIPWSRVIIDGTDTGRDTPVRAMRVAVGPHRVLLRTPDGPEHEVSVMVLPGKTIPIIHRFPQ